MPVYREWHTYWRLAWSDADKADFRSKWVAFHAAGNPEATLDDHRLPWEPADDD